MLGVDTCGPSGSVALALVEGSSTEISRSTAWDFGQLAKTLGQVPLEGRTYSATLVAAVATLLSEHRLNLAELDAIAVVHGPGSFTGIRVGVGAVKGLAQPQQVPVVAVSRLAVLAAKAGVSSAALDARRHEVFLRAPSKDGSLRQLLAGEEELAKIDPKPAKVGVCDESAAGLLCAAWPCAELVRVEPPTAGDAIELCVPEVFAGRFADLMTLDGHYLRRSDAEIFGEKAAKEGAGIRVRPMAAQDIDAVMEIAEKTDHAPRWGRQAYVDALDAENRPRRAVLVAVDERGGLTGFVVAALLPDAQAELESIVTALPHQRRGVARELFAAMKTEARRQGTRDVILEVRKGNRAAREFYRFLGFREEGQRPGYYADPVEDAVLMRLELK